MKKFLHRLREARRYYKLRHTPTGMGFAFADSISFLPPSAWDAVTRNASIFLRRGYLELLEAAPPDNLSLRHALIFRRKTPVAALSVQVVRVDANRVAKNPLLKGLEERVIVCGNLLSWGFHGIAFGPGVSGQEAWPAVAEALYRIRRAERLSGSADFVMIKDLDEAQAEDSRPLARFGYRPLETDPNMVLTVPPAWKKYDDYLASLQSHYRKSIQKTFKQLEAAGCRIERLDDVEAHAGTLHALYLQTQANAKVKLVTASPDYLPRLASFLGDAFRCSVVRRGNEIVGFVTTLRDGEDGINYYVGVDQAANAEAPVYHRLLHASIADGIELGCRRFSFGRTALDAKARLGARPVPFRVWIRHRLPVVNILVGGLLRTVPHGEAPDRNPFKAGAETVA